MTEGSRVRIVVVLLAAVYAVMLLATCVRVSLETMPSWDESWNLTVAKNYVQSHHYGLVRSDKNVGPELAMSAFVVMPIVSSFELFGIGLWQARLPGIILSIVTLGLVAWFSARVFSREAGVFALLLGLFGTGHPDCIPLRAGAFAQGEIPMAFCIICGILLLQKALLDGKMWIVASAASFALSGFIKIVPIPFILAGLLLPMVCCNSLLEIRFRNRLIAVAFTTLSFLIVVRLFAVSHVASGDFLSWLETGAFVPVLEIRLFALSRGIVFGLPLILGWLLYARSFQGERGNSLGTNEITTVVLGGISFSWMLWYLAFSVGFVRYLAPIYLLGLPFAGYLFASSFKALREWLGTVKDDTTRIASSISASSPSGSRSLGAVSPQTGLSLCVLMLLAVYALLFGRVMLLEEPQFSEFKEVVSFLDVHVPPEARIESYESELFFATNHGYHFPTPEKQIVYNLRTIRRRNVPRSEEVPADAAYLVRGRQARQWGMYRELLANRSSEAIFENAVYTVYRLGQ